MEGDLRETSTPTPRREKIPRKGREVLFRREGGSVFDLPTVEDGEDYTKPGRAFEEKSRRGGI